MTVERAHETSVQYGGDFPAMRNGGYIMRSLMVVVALTVALAPTHASAQRRTPTPSPTVLPPLVILSDGVGGVALLDWTVNVSGDMATISGAVESRTDCLLRGLVIRVRPSLGGAEVFVPAVPDTIAPRQRATFTASVPINPDWPWLYSIAGYAYADAAPTPGASATLTPAATATVTPTDTPIPPTTESPATATDVPVTTTPAPPVSRNWLPIAWRGLTE